MIRPASLFTNLVIDDLTGYGSCDDAFVYISDTAAPGIVVYDARKDAAWRFSHPSMYPNPDYSTYTVSIIIINFFIKFVGNHYKEKVF